MKIVAFYNDNDPALTAEMGVLQTGAAAGGYSVIPVFNTPAELITLVNNMLDANNFDCLEELEIVAHGNPTILDGILHNLTPAIGASIKHIKFCDVCSIYLSGCNSAINLRNMDSLAQRISAHGPTVADDNVMLTVYGSVGFISGYHINGTERTTGNRGGMGSQPQFAAGYPDAPDSRGGPGVNLGSMGAIGDFSWRGYREGRRVS